MDLINIRTKKCRMQQNTETSNILKAPKNSSNQSESTSLYDGCFRCYNNFRKLRCMANQVSYPDWFCYDDEIFRKMNQYTVKKDLLEVTTILGSIKRNT